MQVGADHVALADALVPVPAVVAVALEDPAERPGRRDPRCVRPPWFSKPASTCLGGRGLFKLDFDRDVADQARALGTNRHQVDEADARKRLLTKLVGVTEQLVSAADGEDHRAAFGDRVQRVSLDARQILQRTASGRDPGPRRCRRGRLRRDPSCSPRPLALSEKPIPRQLQRRSSSSRLPRSA